MAGFAGSEKMLVNQAFPVFQLQFYQYFWRAMLVIFMSKKEG